MSQLAAGQPLCHAGWHPKDLYHPHNLTVSYETGVGCPVLDALQGRGSWSGPRPSLELSREYQIKDPALQRTKGRAPKIQLQRPGRPPLHHRQHHAPTELTPEMHSPILWIRCTPLEVLSRFLNPDREAAKSSRAIVLGDSGIISTI
jgi:hypothetical protein